jgi:hypothetical protein
MFIVDALWGLLVAVAASPFAPWIVVAAVTTVITFFVAAAGRDAIDAALSGAQGGDDALAMVDLSRGDAARAIERKVAVAPERLWTYGEEYLDHFVEKAAAVTVWESPALEVYWKFVLRVDIGFAISLAAFIVLFWLALATVPWLPPWLGRLAIFAECMGLLYGFADVAEDLKLIAILRDPQRIIDPAEAAAANLLTRLKFVTILLSVVGAVFFVVLSAVDRVTPGLFGLFTRLAPWFWRPAQVPQSQSGGNAAHQ